MASFHITLIIIFSFLLIKASDIVVINIKRLSVQTGSRAFSISAILLALGTSFPELSVGITSAIENAPTVSLGTITGSNIANISLVAGTAALITGRVRVSSHGLRSDFWAAMIAGLMPILLLYDNILSRVDGLILLIIYFSYVTGFFRRRFLQIGREQIEEEIEEEGKWNKFLRSINVVVKIKGKVGKDVTKLLVGIAGMLFCADMIVKSAVELGQLLRIPTLVIGLIIVAIGTSLPEFAFSLKSLEEKEPSMYFGNLLGSTVANSTLIVGLVALISPIRIVALDEYRLAISTFFVVFISFWLFVRSKHRLDRWEAFVMILLYVVFAYFEITGGIAEVAGIQHN